MSVRWVCVGCLFIRVRVCVCERWMDGWVDGMVGIGDVG